jgi:subfamily B ATP-binding cassette protein MsbA
MSHKASKTSIFSKSSLKTYLRLLKSVKPYWYLFVIGMTGTIISSITDAGLAWFIKPLVDKGLVAKDQMFLKWLPVMVILIFVLRGASTFISDYFISRVGRSVIMDFRRRIFSHFLHLPASFYDKQSSGKLISLLIYNVEQLAGAVTEALLTLVQEGFTAIGLIVVMFVISWKLTLLFMLVTPLAVIIIQIMTKRSRKLSHGVQKSVGDVTHMAQEGLEAYKVVRIFGGEGYEKKKFFAATRINRKKELNIVATNSLGSSSIQIAVAIPVAILAVFLNLKAFHISVGSFGALIVAAIRLLTPLRRLTKINTTIQKGIAGAQSIFALLEEPSEKNDGTKRIPRVMGKIEYKNVSFSYHEGGKQVVKNVSFTVNPGEAAALVGHSGAGKSTIVNLLPRFYDVTSGEILIDGVNIRDFELKNLRQQFSLVSQYINLFNDTVAHNIAYGKFEEAEPKDIEAAASAANILDVIQQLPEGLSTNIGEQGMLLSGGQRQRLAIARAIFKNAPILILDEATSALDTESEQKVQAALEKLMNNRTTLVIAHRLSTVEKADRIIVMNHGKIVEEGKHQQLLAMNGHYAKLYRTQFSE